MQQPGRRSIYPGEGTAEPLPNRAIDLHRYCLFPPTSQSAGNFIRPEEANPQKRHPDLLIASLIWFVYLFVWTGNLYSWTGCKPLREDFSIWKADPKITLENHFLKERTFHRRTASADAFMCLCAHSYTTAHTTATFNNAHLFLETALTAGFQVIYAKETLPGSFDPGNLLHAKRASETSEVESHVPRGSFLCHIRHSGDLFLVAGSKSNWL